MFRRTASRCSCGCYPSPSNPAHSKQKKTHRHTNTTYISTNTNLIGRALPHMLRDAPGPAHPRLHEQRRRRRLLREGGGPAVVPRGCGDPPCERAQLRAWLPPARRGPGLSHGGRGEVGVLVPLRRRGRHLRGLSAKRGGVFRLVDAGSSLDMSIDRPGLACFTISYLQSLGADCVSVAQVL